MTGAADIAASHTASVAGCALCREAGGEIVWQNEALRVVLADEPQFPGFTRVIWHAHVREMTDLAPAERAALMDVVWTVEVTMRRVLAPEKINVASLGNAVPHLHWHVVPRWPDDASFPGSPWSAQRQDAQADPAASRARIEATGALLPRYRSALVDALHGA